MHSDFCVCGRETCQHATRGAWLVYTQSFLGVHGVTVGWPLTKGSANNEQVHSFSWFLPNPFIQDLYSQEFVKTELYPLSQDSCIVCNHIVWRYAFIPPQESYSAVYLCFAEFLHFGIQSTGQKSHCPGCRHRNALFKLDSRIPEILSACSKLCRHSVWRTAVFVIPEKPTVYIFAFRYETLPPVSERSSKFTLYSLINTNEYCLALYKLKPLQPAWFKDDTNLYKFQTHNLICSKCYACMWQLLT